MHDKQVRITDEPIMNSHWSVVRAIQPNGKIVVEIATRDIVIERANARKQAAMKGYTVIE